MIKVRNIYQQRKRKSFATSVYQYIVVFFRKERNVSETSYFFEEGEGESFVRKCCHLGVERVLSVAPHRIGDTLLRHQPGLVHVVAVDLLQASL